jgi:hypothetical protein
VLRGDRAEQRGAPDAGVGEDDVQAPARLDDRRIQSIQVVAVSDVSGDAGGVLAELTEGGIDLGAPAPEDEHMSALVDETRCCRRADPARAARDHGGFPSQKRHVERPDL